MKFIFILSLLAAGLCASEEKSLDYTKYQEPSTELVPEGVTGTLEKPYNLKIFNNKGVTVSVDGKVVFFIKDHIAEIRIKTPDSEKKDCTIL